LGHISADVDLGKMIKLQLRMAEMAMHSYRFRSIGDDDATDLIALSALSRDVQLVGFYRLIALA
jgi:hypothetical protein